MVFNVASIKGRIGTAHTKLAAIFFLPCARHISVPEKQRYENMLTKQNVGRVRTSSSKSSLMAQSIFLTRPKSPKKGWTRYSIKTNPNVFKIYRPQSEMYEP
jgi:hypothetical protein